MVFFTQLIHQILDLLLSLKLLNRSFIFRKTEPENRYSPWKFKWKPVIYNPLTHNDHQMAATINGMLLTLAYMLNVKKCNKYNKTTCYEYRHLSLYLLSYVYIYLISIDLWRTISKLCYIFFFVIIMVEILQFVYSSIHVQSIYAGHG